MLLAFFLLFFLPASSYAQLEACSHRDFEAKCLDYSCGMPLDIPPTPSPCGCTQEDIGYYMTPCPEELPSYKHDLVYFWKPPATCFSMSMGENNITEGENNSSSSSSSNTSTSIEFAVLPPPILNIPCDMVCPPGTFINTTLLQSEVISKSSAGQPFNSSDACQLCPAGTRTDGAGQKWEIWEDTLPAHFSTHCTTANSHQSCSPWRLLGDSIDSGINVHDYLLSSLDLQVNLVRPGNVTFVYKVSAQEGKDGLRFSVDDLRMLSVSNTRGWTTFSTALTAGPHKLKWYYYKDHGITAGEDRATLKWIEVTGMNWGDFECEPCPPGYYNNVSGSADCFPCPEGTITPPNAWGSTQCTPCPPGQFSFAGSVTCLSRYPCTPADYVEYLTPCKNGKQDRVYAWIAPQICNSLSPESVRLPASQTGLSCSISCPAGFYFDARGNECKPCAKGTWTDGSSPRPRSCKSCAAGTSTLPPVSTFSDFSPSRDFPFLTGCSPSSECTSPGWRLAHTFMDSGVGHGRHAVSWTELRFQMLTPGFAEIEYLLSCPSSSSSPSSAYFAVELDETVFVEIPCSSSPSSCSSSSISPSTPFSSLRIPLSSDNHRLRFSFNMNGTSSSSSSPPCNKVSLRSLKISGLSSLPRSVSSGCQPCRPGTFSPVPGLAECPPCPAGSYSDTLSATKCSVCPENQYAEEGWARCVECGKGTAMNENRTGCEFSCEDIRLKKEEEGGEEMRFDLSPLARKDGRMYGPYAGGGGESEGEGWSEDAKFWVSLCQRTDAEKVCLENSVTHSHHHARMLDLEEENPEKEKRGVYRPPFACIKYSNGSVLNMGSVIGFDTLSSSRRGLSLLYTHGDRSCQTQIDLVCDVNAGKGMPVLQEFHPPPFTCSSRWIWRSIYACPLCKFEDLRSIPVGECVKGKRKVEYAVRSAMQGKCRISRSVIPSNRTTESCVENPVEIPLSLFVIAIAIAALVSLFLISAIIVAVIYWKKHREIEYKYTRLSMVTGDVAMTPTSSSFSLGQEYDEKKEEEERGEEEYSKDDEIERGIREQEEKVLEG